MTYEEAKATQAKLEEAVKLTGDVLRAYPRNSTGLVSDEIRFSDEYREAKAKFDAAFSQLRTFNASFVRTYRKELRAERASRTRGL